MPPSSARTVLSSSIRSQSCVTGARRTFTSTPAALQAGVGPESPKYIDVPQAPQRTADWSPVVKGALPVPRNIFINRSELPKDSPEFLEAATPEPTKTTAARGVDAPRIAYRQRLASLRRHHYRESVLRLRERKTKADTYLARRGAARQAEQRELVSLPEREDERLTNPSITQSVRDILSGKQASLTEADIQAKKENIRVREAVKALHRKDQLHTLYMHARSFIVTEEQFDKTLEEVFGTEEKPASFSRYAEHQGRSIWARDRPMNTAEMLDESQGRGRAALSRTEGFVHTTRDRIQKIAEELTGGKI
ncbi:uncharacterized protein K452DRAFT_351663 [Aplosporella prunicola CBS 121167]|uniref:Uncharacterized protein n=1 Tax=Aplosporella prunicola CBS 121167 TaxID=1176127 RepID=A0A6A6BC58_9PEZI|nr:uncharacterized protein K452DRAFT_351663 [Aplosporella prunicola CBS 121167]KAF2140963.1 hypothetical protein K452DRAFT_351663 [Aplosporella prunicola CBS 121167]